MQETTRILASVETVVCHRVNTPEDLVGLAGLAGTRQMTEYSTRFSREGSTGEGTAMRREQQKIDANKVLGLPPGEAFVISRGRAMRAQILRAPEVKAPLPGAEARRMKETGAGAESLPSTEQPKDGDEQCKFDENSQSAPSLSMY